MGQVEDGSVPIVFAPTIPADCHARVRAAPHFRRWLAAAAAGFDLRRVTVESVTFFGPRVGFILLQADAWHDGRQVPGTVLLRGDSVSILLVLRHAGHPDRTILTCEARLPAACPDLLSLPAGMLDGETFASTALRELSEEIGADLAVRQDMLVDLATVWLSPGGCDEAIALYYAVLDLDDAAIRALDGRRTGNADERESIRVRVVDLDDIPRIGRTDAKTLLSFYMYRDRAARAGA
ncbi:NUDIX domain-containing protein [Gluconacetobacter azotocaptans]|uniref:NUDIX domain-containing protein n=1 Tax=Gluconacetobacter azotocaptans TaxID=142834 RepID=UPI001958B931|nr:NUDIX domain-containing protein [Gluconacetobacter azotocaptans]MBM9400276.1 NUDIX domain-containing protein [Gluconacetobacter azotocaptans]